jgi:uncharacterized protein (DUF849 family)
MGEKLGIKMIITVAVTGSRPTKEINPAVPYSPEEIVQAAVESYRAGAMFNLTRYEFNGI